MMAITHATIAAAGTSLTLGTANPVLLGLTITHCLLATAALAIASLSVSWGYLIERSPEA